MNFFKGKYFQTISIFLAVFIFIAGNYFVYAQSSSDINKLLSSEGKVLFGDETNSIFVIDYPENIKKVEKYLKMVDVPPEQVLIEARVVEVSLKGEHSLGINWTAFEEKGGTKIGQFRLGGDSGNSPIEQAIPFKNTFYPPGSTSADNQEDPFTITLFDENINIVLQALANNFDTNILSAPRITTVNNREAEIKVIQSLPWAEPEVELSDEGIAITWTVHFEEVGIILKVTPMITDDGNISMELSPEVSEQVGEFTLTVTQGNTQVPYPVPIIDERSANTKVIIGDGQTVIIGGLIKEKTTKGVSKVPFFGDLPGLGWFFKSTKDAVEKTELLIFVSPTIITPKVLVKMKEDEEQRIGKWYIDKRKAQQKAIEQAKIKEKEMKLKEQECEFNKKLKTLEKDLTDKRKIEHKNDEKRATVNYSYREHDE